MSGIISAIFKGLGDALFGWVQGILDRRRLVQEGQTQQAAAESAQSSQTAEAMVDAAAQAPKSKDELERRLKDGTF